MQKTLCIVTSTKFCSVALLIGKEISYKYSEEENTHSSILHLFIDQLLEEKNISYPQLDAIAVDGGPGSYTGLRVGISSAKTFSYALQIPLIAISALEILAHNAIIQQDVKETINICLHARADEYYYMQMDKNSDILTPKQLVKKEFLEKKALDKNNVWIGEGVKNFLSKIDFPINYLEGYNLPTAKILAENLGKNFPHKKYIVDTLDYSPEYLKEVYITQPKN